MPRRKHNPVENMEALRQFVDSLKLRGVNTYKGEVPLPDGTRLPIDIAFHRDRAAVSPGRGEINVE